MRAPLGTVASAWAVLNVEAASRRKWASTLPWWSKTAVKENPPKRRSGERQLDVMPPERSTRTAGNHDEPQFVETFPSGEIVDSLGPLSLELTVEVRPEALDLVAAPARYAVYVVGACPRAKRHLRYPGRLAQIRWSESRPAASCDLEGAGHVEVYRYRRSPCAKDPSQLRLQLAEASVRGGDSLIGDARELHANYPASELETHVRSVFVRPPAHLSAVGFQPPNEAPRHATSLVGLPGRAFLFAEGAPTGVPHSVQRTAGQGTRDWPSRQETDQSFSTSRW